MGDADKLTNIFGNFGNVQRVKFTDKKPDGALIELDDPRGAVKAVVNMNNKKIDGSTLKLAFQSWKEQGLLKRMILSPNLCIRLKKTGDLRQKIRIQSSEKSVCR